MGRNKELDLGDKNGSLTVVGMRQGKSRFIYMVLCKCGRIGKMKACTFKNRTACAPCARIKPLPPRVVLSGVYFLKASNLRVPLVKIGASDDVQFRIHTLITVCPCKLELLGIIEQKYPWAHEAEIHRRFKKTRRHGEWFSESLELLEFIKTARTRADIPVEGRNWVDVKDETGLENQ